MRTLDSESSVEPISASQCTLDSHNTLHQSSYFKLQQYNHERALRDQRYCPIGLRFPKCCTTLLLNLEQKSKPEIRQTDAFPTNQAKQRSCSWQRDYHFSDLFRLRSFICQPNYGIRYTSSRNTLFRGKRKHVSFLPVPEWNAATGLIRYLNVAVFGNTFDLSAPISGSTGLPSVH